MGEEGHEYYMRMLNLRWKSSEATGFRGIWVLLMVLVGYGSNDNRLRVWEKVDWIICHSDCKHLYQRSSSSSSPAIYQLYEPEW